MEEDPQVIIENPNEVQLPGKIFGLESQGSQLAQSHFMAKLPNVRASDSPRFLTIELSVTAEIHRGYPILSLPIQPLSSYYPQIPIFDKMSLKQFTNNFKQNKILLSLQQQVISQELYIFIPKMTLCKILFFPSSDEIFNHIKYAIKIVANQTTKKSENHDF